MLLKNLIKLPEKKKKHYILGVTDANSKQNLIIEGCNQTLAKIGNLELELDVGKIEKVISNTKLTAYSLVECTKTGIKNFVGAGAKKIAQTIANNFKEIIK